MGSEETRRRITFAAAVAVLVVGALAMAVLDRDGGEGAERGAAPESGHARELPQGAGRAPSRGAEMRAAAHAARRFVHAYLRYQEGRLGGVDRETLLRYSTAELGGQLVRAPVRVPPGSPAPVQFVARTAAVGAGLFDGSPAFLVALVVAGRSGTHLLTTSLIEEQSSWVVAGIGP
jgi:hypothetical protein